MPILNLESQEYAWLQFLNKTTHHASVSFNIGSNRMNIDTELNDVQQWIPTSLQTGF